MAHGPRMSRRHLSFYISFPNDAMQNHDCETIEGIAQDEMTDDVLDGTIYPLAAANGHVAMLTFGEGVSLGRKVVVQQLDLGNEATLDAILTDIQAAAAEGITAG